MLDKEAQGAVSVSVHPKGVWLRSGVKSGHSGFNLAEANVFVVFLL